MPDLSSGSLCAAFVWSLFVRQLTERALANNEFVLIDAFLDAFGGVADDELLLGPGDDCALLDVAAGQTLAVTTDTLLPDRHIPKAAPAQYYGYRALAMNLSDLAAMGARPKAFVVAITLPEANESWLRACALGIRRLASDQRIALAGGNLTRGETSITITALGEVPRLTALLRSGASIGDDVYVSGSIGLAAAGLAKLAAPIAQWPSWDELATDPALARFLTPLPRCRLGMALRGVASACIDVSDGLLADLGHLLQSSGVGARLELAAIPTAPGVDVRACLSAGDDYELCFTAPAARHDELQRVAASEGVPLTRIGIIGGSGLWLGDEEVNVSARGFDHFRN